MLIRNAFAAAQTAFVRRWRFDGNPKNLAIGGLSAAAFTLVCLAVRHWHVWEVGFGPPMVVVVAVIANRLGMRSALVCAVVAMVCLEFFFYDGPFVNWPMGAKVSVYISMFAAAVLLARPRPEATGRIHDRGQSLPFTSTKRDGNGGLHGIGVFFWDAEATGRWDDDAHLGSEFMRIWANRVGSGEPAPALPWIIHDMIRGGRWSGLEAGFASALERFAFKREKPAPGAQPPQSGG